jgi:bile acid-coenzyme A ligase
MAELISYARRFTDLAAADPDRVLITCGDDSIMRAAFESSANRLARDLQGRGVGIGDMVTIALPNSIAWFVTAAACWKVGAIPQPVSYRLPVAELQAIVELADSRVVVGVEPDGLPGRQCLPADHVPHPSIEDGPLPDVVSPAWKAPTSGGSTGRPKLIVSGDPATLDPEARPTLGVDPDGCLLMPGPLYHNGPVVWSCTALLAGAHLVVLPRFDAEATLAAIEEHSVDVVYLVPTMMKRIWRLPIEVRERYDVSSLRFVWHLAEPCPPWLKEAWIGWLGAEKIWELYAGTEAQAATIITGTEWLEHRGSVGRPAEGTVLITNEMGDEVPPGEQGEVWLRSVERATPAYRYVGAEARTREGGWESLGDVGWLDADGFLYLGDRLTDMILSGGANIYPAEVEAALQEHPDVRSCAVIGLPDDDLGNRVHAIVEADPGLDPDEVLAYLRQRLAPYKLPRTIEVVDEPLRDDAGKLRRSALRAERL